MGAGSGSGDLLRPHRTWRHVARAFAGRHHRKRQGIFQIRRSGFRHPARCEPQQARHQDHCPQSPPGQPEKRICAGHDCRRSCLAGPVEGQRPASVGAASMTGDANIQKSANSTGGLEPFAIEVDHIIKKYGDFTAVDDVSFQVEEGEIFGLLGPNGAGKSTLIRMMTTLIPISGGKARIAGHDVKRDPDAVRRVIGVIPQALTSDLDLTVEENLNIYAKLYDVPSKKRHAAIEELLQLVDLTKWRSAQTKTLSGGMRRRLEIARGLVHSPRIFFLDEPTTGLDPVSRVAVWEMLTNIKSQRKLTILITTHYMDEADRLCDRIAIVDHGKLVALDSPAALKASVPGSNVIEAQFDNAPPDWEKRLHQLEDVTAVQHEGAGMYRILTSNGSQATTELVEMAVKAGAGIKSLNVQNTTLDDVFVHYTGRQLRDELVKARGFTMPPRPGLQP